MTSLVSAKVRLVRCPKCRQVLAELPEVPLYVCGGCDTVLLAKNRKPETNITVSCSQETDSVAQSRPVEVVESSLENDSTRCNGNSVELCEDTSVKNNTYHGELIRDGSFSDELPCSGEFSLEAQVHNTPEAGEHLEQHKSDLTKQLQEGEFFAEVRNLPDQVNHESVLARQANACGYQKEDHLQEIEPSQIISCPNESIYPPAEQIKEKNSNITKGYLSNAASRCPSKESLMSSYLNSSDNDHPDHFPRENRRNFERFSSLDTFGISSPPMANYPKNGSYYAYYSSASSYDGNHDQIGEKILQRPRKNKDVNTRSREADGKPQWGPMRNHCSSRPTETSNYTSGNKTRLDGPEGFPRLPFPSAASTGPKPASYQHGSQLDLLRTICELQDQLTRLQFPEIRRYQHFRPERGIYSDAFRPHCYNDLQSRVDVCLGQWDPHCRPPQAVEPQDWRYSSQLPMCGDHIKPVNPSISSPLHKAVLDDEFCRARLKEKYFSRKRHIRPLAGGVPVVTCSGCFELLGLPADFLLFDRKKHRHRLTCGSCGVVLRFSLRGGTHIVSGVLAPSLLSNVDACDGGKVKQQFIRTGSFRWAEPVSCSDDYGDGRSFGGKSCSTEGDGRPNGKDSFKVAGDREMRSGLTGVHGEDGPSVGRWRKVGPTSEIEELSSSPPLLRTMGYSSP